MSLCLHNATEISSFRPAGRVGAALRGVPPAAALRNGGESLEGEGGGPLGADGQGPRGLARAQRLPGAAAGEGQEREAMRHMMQHILCYLYYITLC